MSEQDIPPHLFDMDDYNWVLAVDLYLVRHRKAFWAAYIFVFLWVLLLSLRATPLVDGLLSTNRYLLQCDTGSYSRIKHRSKFQNETLES